MKLHENLDEKDPSSPLDIPFVITAVKHSVGRFNIKQHASAVHKGKKEFQYIQM
jgi:hypothetical protein